MKLFTATIESYRTTRGTLLAEGSADEVAAFINSVPDNDQIGECQVSDLEENGGNWGSPPDGWTPEKRFYVQIGDRMTGGYSDLMEALEVYGKFCEEVILEF